METIRLGGQDQCISNENTQKNINNRNRNDVHVNRICSRLVLHGGVLMNKKLDALLNNLNNVPVSVIHVNPEGESSVVAFIDMPKTLSADEKLEKAFMMTNSIESAWYMNAGVTKMFDGKACRSTMVGDFVLIGNVKYKCEPAGWSKTAWKKPLHEWNEV